MSKTPIPDEVARAIDELNQDTKDALRVLGISNRDIGHLLITIEQPPSTIPKNPRTIVCMTAEAWSLRPSDLELHQWANDHANMVVNIGKNAYPLHKVIATIMETESISREASEREAYGFILLQTLHRIYQHYRHTAHSRPHAV